MCCSRQAEPRRVRNARWLSEARIGFAATQEASRSIRKTIHQTGFVTARDLVEYMSTASQPETFRSFDSSKWTRLDGRLYSASEDQAVKTTRQPLIDHRRKLVKDAIIKVFNYPRWR